MTHGKMEMGTHAILMDGSKFSGLKRGNEMSKYSIQIAIVGKTLGNWKVEKIDHIKQYNNSVTLVYFLCECLVCNKKFVLSYESLISEKKCKACKRKIMLDEKINEYLGYETDVHKIAEVTYDEINSRYKYKCICKNCGKEVYKYRVDALGSFCQFCGYLRPVNNFKKLDKYNNEYLGKQFGDLTILDIFYKNHETYVTTKCKCGKISTQRRRAVIAGDIKYCSDCNKKNLERGRDKQKEFTIDNTNVMLIYNCYQGKRKVNKNSRTGINGVSITSKGKFRSSITFQGKGYDLGYYDNLKDAKRAREVAEQKIYGNFLEWYSQEHPKSYKKIRGNKSN